jgi:hypothetical protein
MLCRVGELVFDPEQVVNARKVAGTGLQGACVSVHWRDGSTTFHSDFTLDEFYAAACGDKTAGSANDSDLAEKRS